MDDIIVHCASMKQELVRLGAPADRVKLVRYSIDQKFFSPIVGITQQKNLIVSLGEPRSRDYAALFKAVDGLPVILQAPVYGQWYAREKNKKINTSPPDNTMMMKHLSPTELRYFYASSLFVVLPVYDLVYSAGATVALEAACMARAVIAFRSRGISDYIIDGETGILVEPGNIKALREAIQHLVSNPSEAKRLGDNARQRIVDELNLETYVHNLAEILVKSV
jgi:glycosyltransferase involved in cell wall biosynthesis